MRVGRVASAISCPECHAEIGRPCRTANGRVLASPHPTRLARARALGVGATSGKRRRRKPGAKRRPNVNPRPSPVVIRKLDTGEITDVVSQRSIRSKRGKS